MSAFVNSMRWLTSWCLLLLVLLLSITIKGEHDAGAASNVSANIGKAAEICSSIEINDASDFAAWRKCKIVVGSVTITNLQLTLDGRNGGEEELELAVEEITDYLVVYHVLGVTTLHRILPRLRLIRGHSLYRERYALVVYENRDLRDLGLAQLLRVQKGALRIESNPQLCYMHTIDWLALLGGVPSQQLLMMRNNRSPNYCPSCGPIQDTMTNDVYHEMTSDLPHCWQDSMPQRSPHACHKAVNGTCSHCDENCLGECFTAANATGRCALCANFQLSNGKCAETCPKGFYQLNKRECVEASRCVEAKLIPHIDRCVAHCPAHYKKTSEGCQLQCKGNYVVHRVEDWAPLSNCTKLLGSLTIELYASQQEIIEPLERAFAQLRVITGYVRVHRSPQLISLGFLRNLQRIGGQQLIDGKYALYVVNNRHLENIWLPDSGQNVTIGQGTIFFHINPRLCVEKITQLSESLTEKKEITDLHASPSSNGDRMNCQMHGQLNVTIEAVNSTAARIKLSTLSYTDIQFLLGYFYYYREAPQNVSADDGRHGCGIDAWRRDDAFGPNIRHIIKGLKPNTRYAVAVRTFTTIVTHPQLEAFSMVHYFTTAPSKPGPVATVYVRSQASTEINVQWWPPRLPNGKIRNYYITHEEVKPPSPPNGNCTATADRSEVDKDVGCDRWHVDRHTTKANSNSKSGKNNDWEECECAELSSTLSKSTPLEEDFISREQQIFDETLPNIIYVAKDKEKNSSVEMPKIENENENATQSTEKGGVRFAEMQAKQQAQALKQQDTGIDNFSVIEPFPICAEANATVQYRLEHHCQPLEHIAGTPVKGDVHNYTIGQLKPETKYRITVRACVDGLQNGCGPATELFATTVNKTIEIFSHFYY